MSQKLITGIFRMSDSEYFSKTEYLSNSSFRLLRESALHLEHEDLFTLEGANLVFGAALHCKVLEPDKFDERYAVENFKGCELNKNSNAYKAARREWLDSVQGREILTVDDMDKIEKMARNVNAIAGHLLKDGIAEAAMFGQLAGVPFRGKADYINERLRLVIDLKTTQSISKFPSTVIDYGYHTQAATYVDLLKNITGEDYTFIFLLVETNNPHMVRIAKAGQHVIEEGRAVYTDLISKWVAWKERGELDIIKTVELPDWYLAKVGKI